jgi:hypothetical protein
MFRKVVLLAAPLLLVAACAKEADGGAVQVMTGDAAVGALRSAPDAAADAGTAQFEMVMQMAMAGKSFEITATGAYDAAAQQMAMTMDMGALFEQLAEETGETLPDGVSGAWELVADGDTFYMRAPMFEALTGTPDWLSMTPEDLGGSAGSMGLGASSYDPSKVLESLRGVTGEPEVVGQEDVRGVPTTHYHASTSLADALEQAPADQRDELEASLEQLGDLETAEIPVDIWIDGDDLPRRMQVDMGGAFGGLLGKDASMTMTMEFFAYGEPVDIEIPSADEVTSFSDVMGNGFGDLGAAS